MNTILVTSDLSDESRIANPLAKKIAAAMGAKVHFLAVIEDPTQAAMLYAMDFPVLPDPDVQEQLAGRVKEDLVKIAAKDFADVDYDIVVREAHGPVHDEIINYAQEQKVDLIVMASHGRTGLARMLIGSIAERVVREAPCPILTVPAHPDHK